VNFAFRARVYPRHLEETTMLGNLFGRKQATTTTGYNVPATTTSYASSLRDGANAVLNRGAEFYRQNPRKVQAIGLLAAAALLTRMSSRR
jgi:hypothetical protein